MSGRGFTHETRTPAHSEWYTPPEIFNALRINFDLDVCSPGPAIVRWIPAVRHLTLADDGLTTPWRGRVWMNPPYGSATPAWLERFAQHGSGIALVFSRTDTKWFHRAVASATALVFIRGRVSFIREDGTRGGRPACGSLLIAAGPTCARALKGCGLGFFVDLRIGASI